MYPPPGSSGRDGRPRRIFLRWLIAGAAVFLSHIVDASPCTSCPNVSFGPAELNSYVSNPTYVMRVADFDNDGYLDVFVNGSVARGLPGGRFALIPVPRLPINFSAAVADFDGDGRADVAGVTSSGVQIWKGRGDGTFGAPDAYPGGSSLSKIAAGDFDGDGRPDLVVVADPALFAYFHNIGNGKFAAPKFLGSPAQSGEILTGDFNHDGKLDVFVAREFLPGQIYLGNGDGTFQAPLSATYSTYVLTAAVADFNRDGNPDVVVQGVDLEILYGRGDGTFDPPVVLSTALFAASFVQFGIEDFNGDGFPDVVAVVAESIIMVLSDGSGGFQPAVSIGSLAARDAVIAGDFDRDGLTDVLLGNTLDSSLTLLRGRGDGTLETAITLPGPAFLAAKGDFNGDGKLDVVTAKNGFQVWIGDGAGHFTAGYGSSAPARLRALFVGDVNHDGHADIVGILPGNDSNPADGDILVYLGNGAGGFSPLPPQHFDFGAEGGVIDRVNGDVFLDLVLFGHYNGAHVFLGNGDGTFSASTILDPSLQFTSVRLADFDGDGSLDFAGTTWDQIVRVRRGNGDGSFQPQTDYSVAYHAEDIAIADFDGDGKVDLIVTSPISNARFDFLKGHGDGTFEPSVSIPAPSGPIYHASAAGDVNGDGHQDVVLTVSDEAVVLTGVGDGTFSESARYSSVWIVGNIVIGDWNGDGKPDLVLPNYNRAYVLLNTNCVQRHLALASEAATCATPGSPLSTQPVLEVLDDGGNVVHCAAGTVFASLVPGTGTVGAALGGTLERPIVLGSSTFTDLSISVPGDGYVLQFTDTAYHAVRSQPISVHTPDSVSITGPSFRCPTDLTRYSAGAGFDSYLWTVDGVKAGGGQILDLIGLSIDQHTLTVTASRGGCSVSASMVITVGVVAPPAASNDGPACAGDTIQLTASAVAGAAYAWTGPNGFTSAAQNPTIPSATLAAAGLYSVTVTVAGCTSAPATTTVTVHPIPFRPVAHNDGPRCAGRPLQLSTSTVPNATYSWTGPNGFTSSLQNPSIPLATTADSGVYSVTVTVDGCVSPPASTSVVVAACQQLPVSLSADASGNGILEPGEAIALAPSWMNTTGSPASVTGTATSFTGPAGATYSLSDATADYGTVASGATSSCVSTGDCYAVGVSAPAMRPLLHWDAAFSESLSTGDAKTWSLHIGGSFTDVPTSLPFYRFVETLLHNGVTTGCGGGGYCPGSSVTRAQMAVFLLVSQAGAGYVPPPATGLFADVPAANPFAPWIEELSRRGVTAGCGSGNYCPQSNVTRSQMAVFLLVTREGAGYTPPAPIGVFADVPAGNPFAPWIEELFHRGIAGGCGAGNYCPGNPVSRGQMAVLLTTTFGLSLGGP